VLGAVVLPAAPEPVVPALWLEPVAWSPAAGPAPAVVPEPAVPLVPLAPDVVAGIVVVAVLPEALGLVACLHPTETDATAPMTSKVLAAEIKLFITVLLGSGSDLTADSVRRERSFPTIGSLVC
jgi:hypothetical protein